MGRNKNLLVLTVFMIMSLVLQAQEKKLGLGIMLGQPTGLSAKYYLNEKNALDFGLAYSFIGNDNGFSFHCDCVYQLNSISRSNIQLPLYYGFGARIRSADHSKSFLGARGVVGLQYIDNKLPIDAFIELAPVFNLFPETSLHFDLALGARYYFE
jgi:hypothetical protein